MTVPDFQTIMLPLLLQLSDGKPHRLSDLVDQIADTFGLTPDDRRERLPSGQARLLNRVAWARTYLGKACLLETAGRGSVRITDRGKDLLAEKPARVDMRLLNRYPEYRAFREQSGASQADQDSTSDEPSQTETPEEMIERAHRQLGKSMADDVLTLIKSRSPRFFEKLVLDVLVAMGYGGTLEDAARVLGQTGDGGVDGVIKEDRLGLDVIYVQAKRWDGTVGRPEVQGFAGSLEGYRARKGVFITTGSFSSDARNYVDRIDKRIVLIDGSMLAGLMLQYNVGVSVAASYDVKRIDSDYFSDE